MVDLFGLFLWKKVKNFVNSVDIEVNEEESQNMEH